MRRNLFSVILSVIAALLIGSLPWSDTVASAAPQLPHPAVLPLPGPVTRGYDAPDPDWLPGHRGVDLGGMPGDEVRAAAAGTIGFVGSIGGADVVTVVHGEVRTTYEPVRATVHAGDAVAVGDVIGLLELGHAGCTAIACLHWGLKEGDRYLDPLSLLAPVTVRLVASATPAAGGPGARAAGQPAGGGTGAGDASHLRRPPGPITSPFGMRVHPVTGQYVLHDGTDFGLGCGTPVGAAGSGVVIRASEYGGYGNTVEIDHGMADGHHVVTLYAHLSAFAVRVGTQVTAGQTVGLVGTTGWSTGCHLHFGVYVDGQPVDPLSRTT